ncbi:MAG: hypothetical protein GX122_03845 [Candidatus Cloacimonetes bacterium]|nr:hypothetical protein [Candidatus Cloacimonadota bacterium]
MQSSPAAVIDLGSNTFKYIVGKRDAEGLNILLDASLTVRLAANLQNDGFLGEEAMHRGMAALMQIIPQLQSYQPSSISAIGSQALRQAQDTPLFLAMVKQQLGLDIRVLSGEEEAQLAWQAATLEQAHRDGLAVLDLGGGSLEVIFGDAVPRYSYSLSLGAVLMTARFIHHDPPLDSELSALAAYTESVLKASLPHHPVSRLMAIGGTTLNLATINRHLNSDDTTLTAGNLNQLLKLLASLPLIERKKISGLDPQRADIIIAGAVVVREVLRHLGTQELFVCHSGIRHALLAAAH